MALLNGPLCVAQHRPRADWRAQTRVSPNILGDENSTLKLIQHV